MPAPAPTVPKKKRLLVLGIGNYMCGDASIGFRLAEDLAASYSHPQVDVINGGTIGMGLLYLFEEYSDLIVLDAVDVGAEPGTALSFKLSDLENMSKEPLVSNHQGGALSLLRHGQLLDLLPANVTLIGIQVKDITQEIGLSDVLKTKLEELAALIKGEINRYIATCMS